MGLLPHRQNWGLSMRRECRERFPSHRLQMKPLVSDPGMHHGTCVTHGGIANPQRRGKRSQHSRRTRNPQFCASGKRPMVSCQKTGFRLVHSAKICLTYININYFISSWSVSFWIKYVHTLVHNNQEWMYRSEICKHIEPVAFSSEYHFEVVLESLQNILKRL